ncbi:MAG: hypothetical protein ACKV2Q_35595 [Planctomycetaceae bacterium]
MKRVAVVVVLSGLALSALLAAEKPKPAKPAAEDILMRAKLASSQKVLEGLVEKNFAQIQKGGEELVKVGETNEWVAHDDPTYEHFRREFRRQARKLAAFGDQQNLEGATFAYLGLISTCVECHSHCRDVLRTAAEPPNLKAVPIPDAEGRLSDESRRPVRR